MQNPPPYDIVASSGPAEYPILKCSTKTYPVVAARVQPLTQGKQLAIFDMGFDRHLVDRALQQFGGEQQAVDFLLTGRASASPQPQVAIHNAPPKFVLGARNSTEDWIYAVPCEPSELPSFRAAAEHDRRVRRLVEELVQMITSSRVEDPLLCYRAMRLLSDSLCGSLPSQLVAASCGVINVLVSIMESGAPTLRVQACVTLGAVVCDCPANQEEACRKLVVKSVCQLMNELGRRCESRAELHQSLESLVKNHPENRRLCEQFLDDENFSICEGVESRDGATVDDAEVEVCPEMGLRACRNPHCKLHHYSPAFYRTGKFDVPPRSLRGAECGQGAMCEIVLCGFKHPAPAR